MNQAQTVERQTMTHAKKAAEESIAAIYREESHQTRGESVKMIESIIQTHAIKPAVDELEAKLRDMEAEMDLKSEPNPNGGLAARLNWWKQQSDIAHDNWQKSESARARAVEATRELKEALEKQNKLLKEWFLNARNENKRMGLNDTWSDSSLWGRTDSTITAAEKLLEK